ncbi:MAG: hypothetical protein EXS14_01380 [Planctomycetes bacterium]|nr:hypothetical protein [Planctomycetota bacterium]
MQAQRSELSNLYLIAVPEGCDAAGETALLAGVAQSLRRTVRVLPTDFCTDPGAFVATLRSEPNSGVILPYLRETREFMAHTGSVVLEAGLPALLAGDCWVREGGDRASIPAGIDAPVLAPEAALAAWLGAEVPAAARCGLDLSAFGGSAVKNNPHVALFAELDTVPMMSRRCSRSDLSPTAVLAALEAPCAQSVALDRDVALAPLAQAGGSARLLEWRDRDISPELIELVRACRGKAAMQSVRVIPGERDSSDTMDMLQDAGVQRVVFEVDRIVGVESMPGSSCTVDELESWVVDARRLQMEIGVLLVVGIPGETRARGRSRVDVLRRLLPQHLRCIPFEPTGGHAVFGQCVDRGWWPPGDQAWIREVIRPLTQPSLNADDFVLNWGDSLNLQAEVEFSR